VRRGALLVAADAAYGMRAYGVAASRYGEFVAGPEAPAETARAAMALGWARLRQGERHGARAAWIAFADTRALDPRAPLALALSAELADQAGDGAASRRLLDRIVAQYPSTPWAAPARLGRAVLALRRAQDDEALRDLDAVVRTRGPAALIERDRLAGALAAPGSEAALEAIAAGHAGAPPEAGDALDRFARHLLDGRHREATPYVLQGLVLLTAADRGWSDVLAGALASRLVADFPSHPAAAALLGRVAASAASAGQWPVARRAYETLLARAPAAMTPAARVALGEALLRTGAHGPARGQLEQAAGTGGDEAARALLLLTEIHTAAGDRRAALAAYDRLAREHPRLERSAPSLLAHARLLEEVGQAERARPLLRRVVEQSDGEPVAEAAYRLGQGLSVEGQHAAAVEWYLTAGYAVERSSWARRAWLAAGSSLTALHETREALAVYGKLIPARPGIDVPDDRETGGEAAYRAGAILRDARRHAEALDMFVTSAHLTAGLPAERRALVGALQCLVATGDRASAEVIYRRLQQAGSTEPQLLAQAREALRAAGASARDGGGGVGSALPATAR
jgi:tetratricopeptide (TPR) repeat protein